MPATSSAADAISSGWSANRISKGPWRSAGMRCMARIGSRSGTRIIHNTKDARGCLRSGRKPLSNEFNRQPRSVKSTSSSIEWRRSSSIGSLKFSSLKLRITGNTVRRLPILHVNQTEKDAARAGLARATCMARRRQLQPCKFLARRNHATTRERLSPP